jgi:hypothetical protein
MAILGAVVIVATAACLFAVVVLLRPSAPRTHRIYMATDSKARNVFLAQELRAEGAHHHLDIVLTPKEYGALEALEEVDSASEIKFALVAGGVTTRDYPHMRTVTALEKMYLHLLVKRELADKGIAGLRGKRVALGPPTTASYHLARDVLSFVGLLPTIETRGGGNSIDRMTPQEAIREMERIESLAEPARSEAIAQLPEAVMILAPRPSTYARQLVTSFGYELVALPFAEAYGLDRLDGHSAEGVHIDHAMVTPGVIPAYTYGSNTAQPSKECPTICMPLILVAQDDADREAVSLLLETIYDSPLTTVIRPPPLNEQVHDFPRHPGTESYLHRNDPLLTPDLVSTLITVASGIGAFLSGVIAFYGFLRLRNLNRFESYYREIGQIEMIACGLEVDPAAPTDVPSLRAYLERRLSALKCQAVRDFAAGGLRGEGLMAGIIALINDTRGSLAHMVTARNGAGQNPAQDQIAHS